MNRNTLYAPTSAPSVWKLVGVLAQRAAVPAAHGSNCMGPLQQPCSNSMRDASSVQGARAEAI